MKFDLFKLIKSLSPGEKRAFKMQCKKQSRQKAYLDLYDIIDQSEFMDIAEVEKIFYKKHPGKSIDNSVQYLMKTLTDTLVQIRIGYDPQFQIYQGLMRSKVYFERSIPEEGYREILKVKSLAASHQYHTMQYLAGRLELAYFSERSFADITDHELINLQTKGRNLLLLLRQIQEHHSLYELLQHRLVHSGKSLSNKDLKKLNDLVLSELSLITRGVQRSFESQKLHLLFQSFFFTHSGDYPSALKIFTRLNLLFEEHERMWDQPPYDYLNSLEGILDSLRTMNHFDEMQVYIQKVRNLSQRNFSDHFISLCQLITHTYQLVVYIHSDRLEDARKLTKSIDKTFLKKSGITDHKRQTHLFFYSSLTYFRLREWKKMSKYLNQTTTGSQYQSTLYKATRLLNILAHYEMKDLDFLDYEIRAYKRNFRKSGPMLQIERLVFKVIKFDPDWNNPPSKKQFLLRIGPKIEKIRANKYEHQLLRYFDFTKWIEEKL